MVGGRFEKREREGWGIEVIERGRVYWGGGWGFVIYIGNEEWVLRIKLFWFFFKFILRFELNRVLFF